MITPNDLQRALYDLTRTIPLSGVDDKGHIYAYEYNGTARVIVLAVNALAKIREAENPTQSNAHPMYFQRISNADRIRAMTDEELAEFIYDKNEEGSREAWLEWLKKEVEDGSSD